MAPPAEVAGARRPEERPIRLCLTTLSPLPDGGYPVDSDLDQMTDDGCPLTPDPARWSDPEWRDDPTDGERPPAPTDDPPTPAQPSDSRWQRLRDETELRVRWRAVCARLARVA
jgi:hypothetical protein